MTVIAASVYYLKVSKRTFTDSLKLKMAKCCRRQIIIPPIAKLLIRRIATVAASGRYPA